MNDNRRIQTAIKQLSNILDNESKMVCIPNELALQVIDLLTEFNDIKKERDTSAYISREAIEQYEDDLK